MIDKDKLKEMEKYFSNEDLIEIQESMSEEDFAEYCDEVIEAENSPFMKMLRGVKKEVNKDYETKSDDELRREHEAFIQEMADSSGNPVTTRDPDTWQEKIIAPQKKDDGKNNGPVV